MVPRPLILLAILVLVTGCTTTKEVGPRGDATLYQTKSWWPMVYPYSITFEQIPIDRPGRYRFNVVGLHEAPLCNFDLCIASTEPMVDSSEGQLNKKPLPSAGFKSCVIRLRITDDRGIKLHAETLQLADAMWFLGTERRGNYSISHRTGGPYSRYPKGDFAVSVEVLKPSKTKGDYLKIEGLGFPWL